MQKIYTWLEHSSFGLRLSLRMRYGATGPHGSPAAPWHNAVLQDQEEVDRTIEQVKKLGLPVMQDIPKNWDSLAALDLILKATDENSRIFDAGGETYSMILPWLFLYGYKNLSAGNLVFERPFHKGSIAYHYSDITKTKLDSESYDAITCLSVIEHGVDLRSYFQEMSRILKPGGILITSTDYFETAVNTQNKLAYNVPIHIFTKQEILAGLEIAKQFGFILTGPLDLSAKDKVVHWKQHNLDYTFIVFSLRKVAA